MLKVRNKLRRKSRRLRKIKKYKWQNIQSSKRINPKRQRVRKDISVIAANKNILRQKGGEI